MFNECQLNLNTAELWFLRIAWLQLVSGEGAPSLISLLSFIVTRGLCPPVPAPGPRAHAAAEISIGLQLQLKHRHQVMTPHLPIFTIIRRPNNPRIGFKFSLYLSVSILESYRSSFSDRQTDRQTHSTKNKCDKWQLIK